MAFVDVTAEGAKCAINTSTIAYIKKGECGGSTVIFNCCEKCSLSSMFVDDVYEDLLEAIRSAERFVGHCDEQQA